MLGGIFLSKVLIVEDEANIRGFLKINLSRNGFEVIEAESGEIALEVVNKEKPDIVVLDIMLPGIDGFEVSKTLRQKFDNLGIIILTAKGQDMDKIMGLEYGADDYMVKPFNPMELLLRIKAILRRINKDNNNSSDNILVDGPFKIDIYTKKAFKNNEELDLTPKEYLLIKLFLENKERAFSRDELLDIVWGANYFGDSKIIDVNIRRLRTKIEDDSKDPKYIQTIWGTGYRWNAYEKEKDH